MQKLIVQRGTRYEIRAEEIAPGVYQLSTCPAGSGGPTGTKGPTSGESVGS